MLLHAHVNSAVKCLHKQHWDFCEQLCAAHTYLKWGRWIIPQQDCEWACCIQITQKMAPLWLRCYIWSRPWVTVCGLNWVCEALSGFGFEPCRKGWRKSHRISFSLLVLIHLGKDIHRVYNFLSGHKLEQLWTHFRMNNRHFHDFAISFFILKNLNTSFGPS